MTKYTFIGDGSIFFDEEKTVAELIAYAFDELGISISVHWDRWDNKIRNCGYTKNGREWKRCSYKTYKKYESKYFKGSKVKKAYFVKNTSANRKKKLK